MDEVSQNLRTKFPVVLSHIVVLTFSVPDPWRRGRVLQEEVIHYMPLGHVVFYIRLSFCKQASLGHQGTQSGA